MARPLRVHAPGLLYHAFARGNNKDLIFFEQANYTRFLSNLERFREPLQYKLYAFCLMPNHFHLLIQVGDTPLSKIMQTLVTAYSMYVNKKYEHVGHVFQGRFKSIVVEKESYLLQVQRYVHRNPVESGLVLNPQEYPWSSYTAYLSPGISFPKLEKEEVLELFSSDPSQQVKQFREFSEQNEDCDFDPNAFEIRGVLGGSEFHQKLTKVLKGVRP